MGDVVHWNVEFWDVDTNKIVFSFWTNKDIDFKDWRLGGYDIVEVEPGTCVSYPDGGLIRVRVKSLPINEGWQKHIYENYNGMREPGASCPDEMYLTLWERHYAMFDENGNLKEEYKNDKKE